MADRKNTFLLKRSNVSGNIPSAGQIVLGELALNTADVILYASGTTSNSILPIGWDRVARTGDTMTGTLYVPSVSATTITGNSLNISTTPSNDNALTQVLVRDSDGTIKYRTAASLAGTGSTGASVTAFTYDNLNTLTISDSEGDTFSATINQMSGLTVNGSLSATTIYGDGSNITGMTGSFGITVDGSGSVLTSGVKGYVVMPYNAIITGWDIIGNTSGTCEFDVWRSASPTIPSISDTITGTEKPRLNGQQINSDNTLTTWTTSLSINDVVAFNVVSATTVSRVNLIIKVIKK